MKTLFISSKDIDALAASYNFQRTSAQATSLLRRIPGSSREFASAFSYRRYPTWSFVEAAIHFDELEHVIPRVHAIQDMLKRHRPSRVSYMQDNSLHARCI